MTALRLNTYCRAKCPLLGDSLFVWVQGCPRRCRGCFNVSTLDISGRSIRRHPDSMARLWARKGGGLVLSGGEPFLQAEGLAELCRLVRVRVPETPILAYTGYLFEELLRGTDSDWLELLRQIDVLVDGPYDAENPSNCALAGSGNQRVFFLGDRFRKRELSSLPEFKVQATVDRQGNTRIMGTGRLEMTQFVTRIEANGVRLEV